MRKFEKFGRFSVVVGGNCGYAFGLLARRRKEKRLRLVLAAGAGSALEPSRLDTYLRQVITVFAQKDGRRFERRTDHRYLLGHNLLRRR